MGRRPIVCVQTGSGAVESARAAVEVLFEVAGFPEALAQCSQVDPRADLVFLGAGGALSAGWLERLESAAYSDSTIATATSLRGPSSSPLALRPRIAAGAAHCVWVRRAALDLTGDVDGLDQLSARAAELGLSHVLADDVVLQAPERWPAEQDADGGPLRRTLAAARRAGGAPLSVTIDARALGGSRVGGTQRYIGQLARALAGRAQIRVLVAERGDADGLEVEEITYDEAVAGVSASDVVHRPQQVFTIDDLDLLKLVGRRIVITHQDLIAYRAASYHATADLWQRYRTATRISLAAADAVVFFSEHARRETLAEELVAPARTAVIGACVDAPGGSEVEPTRPPDVPDGPFLLQIGADYAHKNRPFAVALQRQLEALGWRGGLVFAGPHVPEEGCRERLPGDLGRVSEAERAWLYANTSALLYPSTYEGFGLLPYEAGMLGLPCLFAPVAALEELSPAATLVPWDPQASARAVLPLLVKGAARDAHVGLLAEAARHWSWERVADALLEVFDRALLSPERSGASLAAEELAFRRLAHESVATHAELRRRVGFGQRLIDEQNGLLSQAQQRGMMRAAQRPLLRTVLLAPFGALGRINVRGRRSV